MDDLSKSLYWDKSALLTRIADANSRRRHEAGSPNSEEVDCYRQVLFSGLTTKDLSSKQLVILGMTPEIRTMALQTGASLYSIDQSSDAIEMYKNWIPEAYRAKEQIIQDTWWDAIRKLSEPVHAILGDGIFGNILSQEKHLELLQLLKAHLAKDGMLVFRKAAFPGDFDFEAYSSDKLIEKYRSGSLSDAEFGFSMRLVGNTKDSYNPQSFMLDNSITFQTYHTWMEEGKLTKKEYACICWYYFNGQNMILSQPRWEEMLTNTGCSFSKHQLEGKDWYAYYPIYSCQF